MKLGLTAPLTVGLLILCILGTYIPNPLGLNGSLMSILSPITWLELVTWPLIHANTSHLFNNMLLFLLLAPNLETKFGVVKFSFLLLCSSIIIGIAHLIFNSSYTLVGASGWVFMCIILSTFNKDEKVIPIHTVILGLMYAGGEIYAWTQPSNISHLSHLLGGLLGFVFGYLTLKETPKTTLPVNDTTASIQT